jgi:hypothetical protein
VKLIGGIIPAGDVRDRGKFAKGKQEDRKVEKKRNKVYI